MLISLTKYSLRVLYGFLNHTEFDSRFSLDPHQRSERSQESFASDVMDQLLSMDTHPLKTHLMGTEHLQAIDVAYRKYIQPLIPIKQFWRQESNLWKEAVQKYWSNVTDFLSTKWRPYTDDDEDSEDKKCTTLALRLLRIYVGRSGGQAFPLLTQSHLLDLHSQLAGVDVGMKEVSSH